MDHDKPVTLVVGAGMAGLTAAALLAEAGRPVWLVEKEDRVGGLCRSFSVDGVLFDLGPHLFFPGGLFTAEACDLLSDLLQGEPVIKRTFRFAIWTKDGLLSFPPSAKDVLLYPWRYKKEMIAAFLKKGAPSADPRSVEALIREKAGDRYFSEVFAAMTYKKTFLSGGALHRDWYRRTDRDVHHQRETLFALPKENRLVILAKRLEGLARMAAGKTPCYYPAEGYEVFARKLARRFLAAGGELAVSAGSILFDQQGDRIATATVDDITRPVTEVVWTAPVNALNEVLGSDAPRAGSVAVTMVLATFATKRPKRRRFAYIYTPQPQVVFNRIYYPNYMFGKTHDDREGIAFEINHTGDMDDLSDEQITDRVIQGAAKLGLFQPTDLRAARVIRLGECVPVYGLDYEDDIERIFSRVHAIDNLTAVGRQGGWYFGLTPEATSQGIKAARHVLEKAKP